MEVLVLGLKLNPGGIPNPSQPLRTTPRQFGRQSSQLKTRYQLIRQNVLMFRFWPILWMGAILHHFETMGNHCLLAFIGESIIPGFLGGAKWVSSIHSRSALKDKLYLEGTPKAKASVEPFAGLGSPTVTETWPSASANHRHGVAPHGVASWGVTASH